jgi:hypothetical protein
VCVVSMCRHAAVQLAVLLLALPRSFAVWTEVDSPVDRPDVYLRAIDAAGCDAPLLHTRAHTSLLPWC